MRLIGGVLQLDGSQPNADVLRAMAAAMTPAGRASSAIRTSGPLGLVVSDFSPSAPLFVERDGLLIAADARLDEARGLADHDGGDAVLLDILAQDGTGGLAHVLGDFAFALWKEGTGELVCGRDVFGVRPLSYRFEAGRFFCFASFPEILMEAGLGPRKIDEAALARRILRARRPDDSLLAGFDRLQPAHVLKVSRAGIRIERYWSLDRASVGTRRCTPEQAAAELRRLIDQAVRCRLPAAAGVGTHLSGGLDSSAVAVLAARAMREGGRRIHAYSFIERQRNDVAIADDAPFVRAVTEQESNLDWSAVRPALALSQIGTPLSAGKMMRLDPENPENALCDLARQQGVTLILSGWGGDEAASFNGRGTLAELALRGHWLRAIRELGSLRRERGWSVARTLLREIAGPLLPKSFLGRTRRAGRGRKSALDLLRRLLSPAAVRAANADGPRGPAASGRRNRLRILNNAHIAGRAEIWAQTGARYGVAFAFPLLDRRVVEFALSLPSEFFLRDGFRRRVFRDAMAGVLPEAVRLRHDKRAPMPGVLIDLVEGKDELLERIDDYARNRDVARFIDLAALRREVAAFPDAAEIRAALASGHDHSASTAILCVAEIIAAADYLAQHGDGAGGPKAQ